MYYSKNKIQMIPFFIFLLQLLKFWSILTCLNSPNIENKDYQTIYKKTRQELIIILSSGMINTILITIIIYNKILEKKSIKRKKPITVITFGTFDVFHYGHLKILKRARKYGDRLVVGISSDKLNYHKKKIYPIIKQEQRLSIVKSLKFVDEVFYEEDLDLKPQYCRDFDADILIMGDDHDKEYDKMLDGICKTKYLPRTKNISSTNIKKDIIKLYND